MKPELIEHRDFVIQLTDIGRAVEFCKEHDDEELWTALIDYSIDKPYFVHVLLHNIGTHVDPTVLIRKIEDGVEIPGLRDSLVQIMLDYRLQVTIIATNLSLSMMDVGANGLDTSALFRVSAATERHGGGFPGNSKYFKFFGGRAKFKLTPLQTSNISPNNISHCRFP